MLINKNQPVSIDMNNRFRPVVQNLGPGTIYLGDENVTTDTGFQITPGSAYEFTSPGADNNVYVVSDEDNTDVRVMKVG